MMQLTPVALAALLLLTPAALADDTRYELYRGTFEEVPASCELMLSTIHEGTPYVIRKAHLDGAGSVSMSTPPQDVQEVWKGWNGDALHAELQLSADLKVTRAVFSKTARRPGGLASGPVVFKRSCKDLVFIQTWTR